MAKLENLLVLAPRGASDFPRAGQRFEVLDGWRGVAALSVALLHLSAAGHFYAWVQNAGVFVDLFFVLSGFVLYHSYFDKLSNDTNIWDFGIRRFGRIWPLHIFALALAVLLEVGKLMLLRSGHAQATEDAFSRETSVYALATNIFLVHSLGLHDFYTWNRPSWSISVEWWTYLIFATIARFATRAVVGLAIALVSMGALVLHLANHPANYRFGLFRCVLCFFVGVLMCRLYRVRPRYLSHPAWEWLAFSGAIAVALLDQLQVPLIKAAVFGFLVLVFAHQAGPLSRVFLSAPIQKLGLYSYSVYMLHFVILSALNACIRVFQQWTGIHIHETVMIAGHSVDMIGLGHSPYVSDLLAVVYLLVVCMVASLTYRFIEDPARHFFNELAGRSRRKLIPDRGETSAVG